jgi:hypothetical protein
MPKALRISCCVYRFLLDFYPREFRQRFGVEMMQVFAEQMAEEWKRHGIGGAVRVGLTAGWEVSSPGELHPEALSELYMNLSAHTAPTMEPRRAPICQ